MPWKAFFDKNHVLDGLLELNIGIHPSNLGALTMLFVKSPRFQFLVMSADAPRIVPWNALHGISPRQPRASVGIHRSFQGCETSRARANQDWVSHPDRIPVLSSSTISGIANFRVEITGSRSNPLRQKARGRCRNSSHLQLPVLRRGFLEIAGILLELLCARSLQRARQVRACVEAGRSPTMTNDASG